MPECKDIFYYSISVLGILITGLFSFFVWRATVKSTQLAQESYNLSQSMINSQKQLKINIKNEYIHAIISRANVVLDSLTVQKEGLIPDKIKEIPKKCGLSEVELAEYFDIKEREIINDAWDILNKYLNKYWTERNGKFKGSFNRDELNEVILSIEKPIEIFNQLVNSLK